MTTKGGFSSAGRLKDMVRIIRKYNVLTDDMTPEKLRYILEELGPTFVKLGQILSMRPNFLSEEYAIELTKLQTQAKPLDYKIIEQILTKEYNRDVNTIFESIEPEALGSASIAQVHRARLLTGERVVLKVQRPGVYDIMANDIMLLKRVVTMLQIIKSSPLVFNFMEILDEMWNITKQEMDFMLEAEHLEEFRSLNSADPQVTCPQVYYELTTARVLAMEYIDGFQIDDILELDARGYSRESMGEILSKNYIKQILVDGYFHADPHPGNIRVRNMQIVWLDLGMMGRLSSGERDCLKRAMYSLVNHDTYGMKNAILGLCRIPDKVDHFKLYDDIDKFLTQYGTVDLGALHLSRLIQDMLKVARQHNLCVNPGLSIFGRGVLVIEGILKKLCPNKSFADIFVLYMQEDFRRNFSWEAQFNKFRQASLQVVEKSMQLPEQISDILRMTMSGQTKMNLDVTGSEEPLRHLDKMINKLILGILCSALVLGSSIICTTNMTPKFMEIPVLGVIGYVISFVLSLRLFISILRHR